MQYSYGSMMSADAQSKRKAVRASQVRSASKPRLLLLLTSNHQACESCRAKKCKCDEERPTCSNCAQNNIPCSYRNLPPPK